MRTTEPPSTSVARLFRIDAGLAWGLLGVIIFSLTLPFTRIAVAELDPTWVALARAVVAGSIAGVLLMFTGSRWPDRSLWRGLGMVSVGVVFGFPLASSWAMRQVAASHGAIIAGLLPLATAAAAALRFGERPSLRFWVFAFAGSGLVIGFAAFEGWRAGLGFSLQAGDAWMLLAVALASIGYAEGGTLASRIGGWQTICWALVFSLPVLVPIVLVLGVAHRAEIATASTSAWWSFAYVSVFSMFLGFFAWYRGLAIGGIARVGQVQLLQLFFTIAFAAIAFGEHVSLSTWIFALAVVACVMVGRNAPVQRRIS